MKWTEELEVGCNGADGNTIATSRTIAGDGAKRSMEEL
jgi:hypothetical protein